jgi:hypothetical protein
MKRVLLQWGRVATLRGAALLLVYTASLLMTAGAASAQTVQQRLDAVTAHMKQLQALSARLPASAKEKLSSGTQHMLLMAGRWDELQPMITRNVATTNTSLSGHPFNPSGSLKRGDVSDPSTDLLFSRMAGFTQSETSTAWCGNRVVVAYNDSGSVFETFPLPVIGLSFNGYSLSTDGGRSFTDQGFLPPGPNLFNFLGGDPVIACSDEGTFYQSSIFQTGSSTTFFGGVSVSKSTDGGRTFGDPVAAVLKDGNHIIDKPWMAVDPSNPNNIYVTYTDFDFTGTICTGLRIGIELVKSSNGGATWGTPKIIDNGCFPNFDQGTNVEVDRAGNVYVAWEQFPALLPTNEIDIVKSTNGGTTFGAKTTVAIVTPVGSIFGLLQGGFRNNEFPSLAIDRSGGARNGTLYITWNDGVNGVTPDGFPPFAGATYNFGDVFVSRSSNGGANWSVPVKVNDNTDADDSPADHYLPGVAVSSDGSVGICWYDRRRDPENFLIDRECGSSKDGGQNWRNHRVTKESFSPVVAQDQLINPVYMGDYDGVAADILGEFDGFRGAYGDNTRGNPDVKISRRFGGKTDGDDEDQ